MPRYEEHDRADAKRIADNWIDDIPWSTEIEQEGAGIKDISQKTVQHGHSNNGMVFFQSEDIHHERDDIGSPGKCNTGDDVESNPYSPWKVLAQICRRAETFGEPKNENYGPHGEHNCRDDVERCKDPSFRLQLTQQEAAESPGFGNDKGE